MWELYLNLNRFSRNFTNIIIDLIQYAVPIFAQIEGYIGTLVHHLSLIGQKYMWELYLNLNRSSRNLTQIILDSIQCPMQNFVQIERYIGTLVHHLPKIGRNYIWELYLNLNLFPPIPIWLVPKFNHIGS